MSRERAGPASAGTRHGKQAVGRARRQRISGKETAGISGHGHGRRQLGGRTDDLTGLRAATFPSLTRKTGQEMKKRLKTRFMCCQRFAAEAGPGCHVQSAMPSSRAPAAWGAIQKTDRSPGRSWCRRRRPGHGGSLRVYDRSLGVDRVVGVSASSLAAAWPRRRAPGLGRLAYSPAPTDSNP